MATLTDGRYIKKMPSPYSKSQVLEWLTLIGYNITPSVKSDIENDTFRADLDNLKILMRLHIVGIPFENTEMHYSPEHYMVVEPQGLFQRLVKEKNGSYCFGKTGLLLHMLRGLGYRVYPACARVNENQNDPTAPPIFTPTTHLVLFVQPIPGSNVTYLVDVGFGGTVPVRPILLEEGNVVEGATPTEKHRLSKGFIPGSSSENPTEWVWQVDCLHLKEGQSEQKWKLLYVFDETERFQVDINCGNHYVATFGQNSTVFADNVLAIKHFWLDEAPIEERQIGTVILFRGRVRRNIGAHAENIKDLKTDEERIEALREYFGVTVEKEWISNIKGRSAALA
ncbi:arylamine n-acetyltransferase 1 [Moniliophthora roreri MCA 2997]|uniref:Tpa: arylamine n-acetyltransferase 1 n=2 Tax=Moniliophthora roreri TaxID=221103 RepID=V2YHB0_MONRO|nr:arylamine n-acetyltransferase 1 [Moniliophthora roreri MCA 2997]KAI3616785.1 arylamine n-acetyltransferase 1 [Moniliophthora roreri]